MGGKFITIEGCDGSGKSTQVSLVKKTFKELKIPYLLTREPGGTRISEEIRNVILDESNKEMVWRTEALLYAASRAQLVGQIIKPALAEGINVICDRYVDSTLAYQGYGRGLSLEELININNFATNSLKPDLTILLDIDPEETLHRRSNRKADRLEKERLDFHYKIRKGFLELAKNEPQRIKIVAAHKSIEEVHKEILNLILPVVKVK
jgi:dTMP kinase